MINDRNREPCTVHRSPLFSLFSPAVNSPGSPSLSSAPLFPGRPPRFLFPLVSFSLSATPAVAADVAAAVAAAATALSLSFSLILYLQSDCLPTFFHSSSSSFSLLVATADYPSTISNAASSWFSPFFLEILLFDAPTLASVRQKMSILKGRTKRRQVLNNSTTNSV